MAREPAASHGIKRIRDFGAKGKKYKKIAIEDWRKRVQCSGMRGGRRQRLSGGEDSFAFGEGFFSFLFFEVPGGCGFFSSLSRLIHEIREIRS